MKKFTKTIFSPEHIFLVDGLGAAYSATMLGLILAYFEPFFGMPTIVLYPLAGVATCLALYSLSCHVLKPERWQIFLRGIATLNLAYCTTSVLLMNLFWNSLTVWGVAYFVAEKFVVIGLAFQEFYLSKKVLSKFKQNETFPPFSSKHLFINKEQSDFAIPIAKSIF